MRRIHIVTLVGLILVGPVLAGCADFDLDKLDVFGLNEKKKLPGERKELFPGGVPGVTQGIPPEFMKGNQPPPETAQAPAADQNKQATGAEAGSKTAAAEEEPKPAPKRKPKPRAPTQVRVGGPQPQNAEPQPQQQATPWPQQQQQPAAQHAPQPAQQQGQAPWPAQGQTNASAPWPAAPSPGTFSR
jgi:hypothetical protein